MWIFKNDAFVSIVQDRDDPDMLWVRARIYGDIERFFDGDLNVKVTETPDADYRFRVMVSRTVVRCQLEALADGIHYDNFKNSIGVSPVEEERHTTYLKVWTAMMAFQQWARRHGDRDMAGRRVKKGKG